MAAARKVSIAVAIAIVAIACGRRAHGQANDARPVFPVELTATQPGSYVHVRGDGRDRPCGEHCVLDLPRHDYGVIVRAPDGYEYGRELKIVRPTSLSVSPGNHRRKVLGIGLFASGLASIVAGVAVVFLWVTDHQICAVDSCVLSSPVPTWRWYAGGISVASGIGVGAAGLILWRLNNHATLRVGALSAPPSPSAAQRATPAAEPQLPGLRLTGRF